MTRPLTLIVAALILGVGFADMARADALKEAFLELPATDRVAIQTLLARADLYLAPPDGRWSRSTERALHRGADKLTQLSRDRVHPVLHRPEGAHSFLAALQTGEYATLLITGKTSDGWGFLGGE